MVKRPGASPVATRNLARRALFITALVIAVSFPALTMAPTPVKATLNYDFELTSEIVVVHILADGSIDIDYSFSFINYGQLDGVDIGLPNDYYKGSSARASVIVDGNTINQGTIHKSPYIAIGMAVEFDTVTRAHIELPAKAFVLKFHVNNPHMVFENELKSGTIGMKFRPTWFDTSFQRGLTGFLSTAIYFPPAFTNTSAAVYLKDHPWDSIQYDSNAGLVVSYWNRTAVGGTAQASGGYDVGVGFPKGLGVKYFKHSWWDDLQKTVGAMGDFCWAFAPCLLFGCIFGGVILLGYLSNRKRMKDYFDPKLTVVGAGPRRDLTAVEAAIVLEKPLEMVATMILFGLLRKGVVQVTQEAPTMTLQRLNRPDVTLYDYERDYVGAISPQGFVDHSALQTTMVNLVKNTQTKVQGFDFEATKTYYVGICERAWSQVQAARTPEEFGQGLDQHNDWMMLDRNYYGRMDRVYYGLPYYVPVTRPMSHSGTSWGSSKGLNPQQAAQQYVHRVQSSSRNLTSGIKNLSRDVTGVTHPMPVSSGGGGGCAGGGCACACACACAGGGR